jgi:DNA-binding MarR family transcriptional regulator
LSPRQVQLLKLVKARPGATVGELAAVLKETRPNTRNILYRLVERGLLIRQHGERKVQGFKPHIGKVNVYYPLDSA